MGTFINFEQDGRRYSHTINPKTGRPVTHRLASVTVLVPRTAQADALATAFLVLGPTGRIYPGRVPRAPRPVYRVVANM